MGVRINICHINLVRESAKVYDLDHRSIRSPEDAFDIIESVLHLSEKPQEHLVMAALDTKNQVLGLHTIHIGTLNTSLVSPRNVFQAALLNNAACIMVFHNHPSGDPTPSKEDLDVTHRLRAAGKLLGIELLDHIVIGSNRRFVSIKQKEGAGLL